ncbi:5'/3'-nucleotidase SurE [Bacteroidales bacterium OttesenSCG-928-I14]|nr:5'/3'-nucleotidase SurE [Bacteroidales bacterium OttesenSCG-928-I14]
MDSKHKPLILITNDDGYQAKGINQLIEVLRDLGELVVVAPDGPRSGMSSAISSINPIRISKLREDNDLVVYSCTGTPVDCIKLGVNEICSRKPDMVVTGINHGSNSAVCVIYSGTIGAALEGCIFGIPSLGVSLTDHSPDADFTYAVKYGRIVAEKVLKEGLPKGICLNLNIPNVPEVKGLKVCTQTKGYWAKEFQTAKDPSGKTVYWLTGEFANEDIDNPDNDEWALSRDYASIVPLQIDMTAYSFLEQIKHWES